MSGRRARRGAVLLVTVNRQAPLPLQRQICDQVRDGIASGRLARGAALPSTRALALDLGVSRSTVVRAAAGVVGRAPARGRRAPSRC